MLIAFAACMVVFIVFAALPPSRVQPPPPSRPSRAGCPSPAIGALRALRAGLRQPLARWRGRGWSPGRGAPPFGERAGERVRRIGVGFGHAGETPTLTGPRCASIQGFSLHANTQVPAHRRDQLERLIRYTARGAVSLERLTQDTNGDLVYTAGAGHDC